MFHYSHFLNDNVEIWVNDDCSQLLKNIFHLEILSSSLQECLQPPTRQTSSDSIFIIHINRSDKRNLLNKRFFFNASSESFRRFIQFLSNFVQI